MGDILTISCFLPGYPAPGLPPHLLPAFSSAATLAAKLSSPSSMPRPASGHDTTASSLARSSAADTKSTASPPRPCASEQSLYSRSPDKTSRSPTPHNLLLSTEQSEHSDTGKKSLASADTETEDAVMEAAETEERPGSVAAMSSGSVDEELEDESMGDNVEDEDDIAEAEDLSIKSQTPTKSESSNPSPASNSLIGELMSKFGFNDIQEYQVKVMIHKSLTD